MSKLNQFASYGLAYLGWICSLLLWLLFMIIGRNALAGVLEVYYIQGGFTRRFQAQFADRVWWVITTIIWIILMVVVEEYLRHGVKKGDLLRRIGRVFAPIVILIFIVDLTLAYLVGFETQPWIRWLLLLVELLAGIGLIWLGKKPPTPANSSNNAMVK